MNQRPILGNLIAFQLGWFTCVISAAQGFPWLGAAAAMAVVIWHASRCPTPHLELLLAGCAGAIGLAFDSFLVVSGWIDFHNGEWVRNLAPVWILALWMLFATTLNASLRALKSSTILAILCGAIAGPLAYLGGERLGALTFGNRIGAIVYLSLGWAALTPLLLRLATRLDGYDPRRPHSQRGAHV